jgi:hypothetical protein
MDEKLSELNVITDRKSTIESKTKKLTIASKMTTIEIDHNKTDEKRRNQPFRTRISSSFHQHRMQ